MCQLAVWNTTKVIRKWFEGVVSELVSSKVEAKIADSGGQGL